MASAYDHYAAKVAAKLAGKWGATFTLVRFVSHENVDGDGNLIPAVTTELRVRGIVPKPKEIWNKGAYLGQQRVVLLDHKIAPFPDDRIVIGPDTFTVESVKTVAPDGMTVILYEAVLR